MPGYAALKVRFHVDIGFITIIRHRSPSMALISIFHLKKAKTISSARFTSPYQTHQNNEAQF